MKLETRLKHYFRDLHETARRRDAREERFYPALQAFLNDCAREQGHDEIHVTVNPRPTEGGNPDLRIWGGDQRVIGYVEAKQPGAELRAVADSEQLERYRRTFPNLILTDFCELWLFRDGDESGRERYRAYPQVGTLFPLHVAGIITARDEFVIDLDRKELERRIVQFRDLALPTEILRDTYKLKDTRGWKIDAERRWLSAQED